MSGVSGRKGQAQRATSPVTAPGYQHKLVGKRKWPKSFTLNDKEPSPSGHASGTVELKDTSCNETSKGGGEDVSGVEDGNSGCDFGSGVEVGNDVDGSGVVRGLNDT